nr:hypothetical protein [Tanacetum cinerariifolium]
GLRSRLGRSRSWRSSLHGRHFSAAAGGHPVHAGAGGHALFALGGSGAGAVVFFAFGGRFVTVVGEGGRGRNQQGEGEQ